MPLPKKKGPELKQEVIALFTLFPAAFFLLCLVSYAMPLLGTPPVLQEPSNNWCGSVGYYISHYLFNFFGLTSFLPVLVLIYTSVSAFVSGNKEYNLTYIVTGISGILLSMSALLATFDVLLFPAEFIQPGGYLGRIIWRISGQFLGGAGSVLFFVLILIFSLMAAVHFSLLGTAQWCFRILAALPAMAKSLVGEKRENRKRTNAKQPEPAVSLNEKSMAKRTVKSMPAVHEPAKIDDFSNDTNDEEFTLMPQQKGDYQLPSIYRLKFCNPVT